MAAILITGAGSGIGRALVERGLARGDRVIACVLNEEEGAGFEAHPDLKVIPMDVSSTESVASGFATGDQWLDGSPLNVVIHCAGVCPLGAVEEQPIEMLGNTLNINAVGSARVLQQSLPRLRGHDGRVALVSSLWGKVSGPVLSAYCSSKHAIEAIADSARRETHGQDVHVIVLEPGVVRTGIVSNQIKDAKAAEERVSGSDKALYGSLYKSYAEMVTKNSTGGLSPDEAAERMEKAVFARKPKARYCIGNDARAITLLARLLPDSGMDKLFRSMFKQ